MIAKQLDLFGLDILGKEPLYNGSQGEMHVVYHKPVVSVEDEYVNMVNAFYGFWNKHVEFFDDGFLNYFTDGPLKNRLTFDVQSNEWLLG